MARNAYLICVTDVNNNKFYQMTEVGDRIHVEYGRVGSSKQRTAYPIGKWESLYRSKIKKGYIDRTELFSFEVPNTVQSVVSDNPAVQFLMRLRQYADVNIASNYLVASNVVTQAQVGRAQNLVDRLSILNTRDEFNDILLELFSVIPRKMSKVNDFLAVGGQPLSEIVSREQDTLDVMRGRVSLVPPHETNETVDPLSEAGVQISESKSIEVDMIRKLMANDSNRFVGAYSVVHPEHSERFKKDTYGFGKQARLLWHGSRNQNWWHIVRLGLMIRPANAIKTGSMYGYGLYFADKAAKSIGYTSSNNSYWAHGRSETGFIGLYEVRLGETLRVSRRQSLHGSLTDERLKQLGRYDSLSALAGTSLYNNEYIVYRAEQCHIQYLVEIK